MFTKRVSALLAALILLLGAAGTAQAAEVDCDTIYCFSQEDFSGEGGLAGICITELPDHALGTVLLGTRVLQPGDILTVEQLAQMTFSPLLTQVDRAASVTYLPIYQDHVAASATMTIAIRGKEDKAPVAEDFAAETYKNLPIDSKLKVQDPEGQALTFTVTRAPKRGQVELREDGSFTYTPKKNKVGIDSFVYTATDSAGNVSREATVTITIVKPTDATQYTDTVGNSCRFAAEWMKNTGIFVGETLDGNPCFNPSKAVTRGEFVTMLVKTLDIPTDSGLVVDTYSDQIPTWLQPYLAAAVRSGLTTGLSNVETFGADQPITGAEAAVMLQNALDLAQTGDTEVLAQEDVSLEASALAVLSSHGISIAEDTLTRSGAAQMLYQASCLAEYAPGMTVLRAGNARG